MNSGRQKTFYLHGLSDPNTNNVLVSEIIGFQNIEDNKRTNVVCASGAKADLYICSIKQIRDAVGAISEFHLKFQVLWGYTDEPPQLWRLWESWVKRKKRDGDSRRAIHKSGKTTHAV
ncbi:MAG: hypothetical protein Q7S34_03540 [bacterium]|nr:hypothetical protein [bacterium]